MSRNEVSSRDVVLDYRMSNAFFEIQAIDSRLAAGRDQQQITSCLPLIGCDYEASTILARRNGPAPDKSDAFAFKDTLHHVANFRLFLRQQPIRDYRDF